MAQSPQFQKGRKQRMSDRMDVSACRALIGAEAFNLSDVQVLQLRDFLFTLSDVIVDAFIDLDNLDQGAFSGPSMDDVNPVDEAL